MGHMANPESVLAERRKRLVAAAARRKQVSKKTGEVLIERERKNYGY